MLGCPSSRAFSWARTTTERACVVNRSNTGLPPPREEPPPRVLLVHRLPAHAELVGDLLPGPIGLSGVPNLERFELLEEFPECGDRVQADPRIRVSRGAGELGGLAHVGCQCTLTALVVSTLIDEIEGRTLPLDAESPGDDRERVGAGGARGDTQPRPSYDAHRVPVLQRRRMDALGGAARVRLRPRRGGGVG